MSCSQPDPLGVNETEPERAVASTSTRVLTAPGPANCRRCSQPAIAFVSAGSYCSPCFDSYLHSKFKRSAEGVRYFSRTGASMDHSPLSGKQSKPRRSGKERGAAHLRSKVLLGFSGGLGSRILLELLKGWFPKRDPASRAPPAFEGLVVVHVEMDTQDGQDEEEKSLTQELKTLVESTGIEDVRFIAVPLSDIFKVDLTHEATSQNPFERHQKLIQLLHPKPLQIPSKSKTDHTSLQSLQRSLLLTLLRRLAREEGCEVLVTGEGSDRVAELTIEGMALGRGYAIGEEVGVEWEVGDEGEGENEGEGKGLLVARPVSGLLRGEMEELVRVKGLVVPRPDRRVEEETAERAPTIQAVVGKFVTGLQEEFPSTVQTVLATVHKLGMRSTDMRMRREEEDLEGKGDWKGCAICGGPVQEGAHQWRMAITISDLSKTGTSTTPSIENVKPEASNGVIESKSADPASSLDPLLCYACLSIPKAIAKTEALPSYVERVERQSRNRGRTEHVVKEFSLEE